MNRIETLLDRVSSDRSVRLALKAVHCKKDRDEQPFSVGVPYLLTG